MKNEKIIIKLKRKLNLPNEQHRQERWAGGRVHTDKSKLIPRKKKYKNFD